MWDLPRPGLEPVSPELAGGFLTTAPPGKSPEVLNLWDLGAFKGSDLEGQCPKSILKGLPFAWHGISSAISSR